MVEGQHAVYIGTRHVEHVGHDGNGQWIDIAELRLQSLQTQQHRARFTPKRLADLARALR